MLTYQVELTKLGPVVSDLKLRGFASYNSPASTEDTYKNKLLTFKWTGFEYSDEINTFLQA